MLVTPLMDLIAGLQLTYAYEQIAKQLGIEALLQKSILACASF